jgi:quinolinate synthase
MATIRSTAVRALRHGVDEVLVDPEVAARARTAVERMVAIGTPSPVGE